MPPTEQEESYSHTPKQEESYSRTPKQKQPKAVKAEKVRSKPSIPAPPLQQLAKEEPVTAPALSKPQITPAKTKPFTIRETPKRPSEPEAVTSQMSYSKPTGVTSEPSESSKSHVIYDSEKKQQSHKFKPKYVQDESEALASTQLVDRPPSIVENEDANSMIRKSMSNVKLGEKMEDNQRNMNKQINRQINNSSSQSNLNQMNGIMDLGSKKRVGKPYSVMNTEGDKRHDTIKIENQTTKPMLNKTGNHGQKKLDVMRSFDENSSATPNLTANTIVNGRTQSSEESNDEEEHKLSGFTPQNEKKFSSRVQQSPQKPIVVEKQESSSSEEEQEEQSDNEEEGNESDEMEFPVALNGLVFSFLPQDVAEKLNSESDWKRRTNAIQETENLIKKQFSRPNDDFSIYIPDISKKMCKMMHDSNFKISLTSLRIIHNLCMKYPKEMIN